MTERDFIYWLQGYLEMSGATTLNETQLKIIKDHIKQVVVKVTPNYSLTYPGKNYMPHTPNDMTVIC